MKVLLTIIAILCTTSAQSATIQSKIIIKNNSEFELIVESLDISGDPLSNKAWKKGATHIGPGSSKTILTINRSGKLNWMDPTPRFIEPGKTAIFTAKISLADTQVDNILLLKQKLFGTGKSSKMWHLIESKNENLDWVFDDIEFSGAWQPNQNVRLKFSSHSSAEGGATNVQYVISTDDS